MKKLLQSLKEVIDYAWADELRHFEEDHEVQVQSQDALEPWIKTCEEEGWTHDIFYHLMKTKLLYDQLVNASQESLQIVPAGIAHVRSNAVIINDAFRVITPDRENTVECANMGFSQIRAINGNQPRAVMLNTESAPGDLSAQNCQVYLIQNGNHSNLFGVVDFGHSSWSIPMAVQFLMNVQGSMTSEQIDEVVRNTAVNLAGNEVNVGQMHYAIDVFKESWKVLRAAQEEKQAWSDSTTPKQAT